MASEGAETASQSGHRGAGRDPDGRPAQTFVRTAAARVIGVLRRHGVSIATALAVLGGLLLLYAETLDLYRIVTPSGSISNATGSVRTGSDQHSWALAVIGVAGAGASVLARVTRQRLPALAAAMLGVIALVTALGVDLPDVTASGVTTDFEVGNAEPAAGFWMELVGAAMMTAAAGTLAALLGAARGGAPRGPGARP